MSHFTKYLDLYYHSFPQFHGKLSFWNVPVLKDGKVAQTIGLIPYTGESEELSVKISDEELEEIKDDNQ